MLQHEEKFKAQQTCHLLSSDWTIAVGEGFCEHLITAKSRDKSITLRPLGLSEFVLITSVIKSTAGQKVQ